MLLVNVTAALQMLQHCQLTLPHPEHSSARSKFSTQSSRGFADGLEGLTQSGDLQPKSLRFEASDNYQHSKPKSDPHMHEAVHMFCSSGFEYCSPVCEQPEPSSSDKIPQQVVKLIVSQCYQYGAEFLVYLWYRVSQVELNIMVVGV